MNADSILSTLSLTAENFQKGCFLDQHFEQKLVEQLQVKRTKRHEESEFL